MRYAPGCVNGPRSGSTSRCYRCPRPRLRASLSGWRRWRKPPVSPPCDQRAGRMGGGLERPDLLAQTFDMAANFHLVIGGEIRHAGDLVGCRGGVLRQLFLNLTRRDPHVHIRRNFALDDLLANDLALDDDAMLHANSLHLRRGRLSSDGLGCDGLGGGWRWLRSSGVME